MNSITEVDVERMRTENQKVAQANPNLFPILKDLGREGRLIYTKFEPADPEIMKRLEDPNSDEEYLCGLLIDSHDKWLESRSPKGEADERHSYLSLS